jgi:hypothetical protein
MMTMLCEGLALGFLIGLLSAIALMYWITTQEEKAAQEEIRRSTPREWPLAASGSKETDQG